jgi:dTDP-4-dehydrorhamnose 3,5-epimerase
MLFRATPLEGAWIIELERRRDARGSFARSFCAREFAAHGLNGSFLQANVSGNERRGTLRGLHFQHAPHEEAKLVRCTKGAIFDVIVDLRPASPSFRRWLGLELRGDVQLYIPKGMAHGYLTLEPESEVTYLMSAEYAPEAATGIRYDDPAIGIRWPRPVEVISEKDASWPLLDRGGGAGQAAEGFRRTAAARHAAAETPL